MLLNCVVFPTQQAYKYYTVQSCDQVNEVFLCDVKANQEYGNEIQQYLYSAQISLSHGLRTLIALGIRFQSIGLRSSRLKCPSFLTGSRAKVKGSTGCPSTGPSHPTPSRLLLTQPLALPSRACSRGQSCTIFVVSHIFSLLRRGRGCWSISFRLRSSLSWCCLRDRILQFRFWNFIYSVCQASESKISLHRSQRANTDRPGERKGETVSNDTAVSFIGLALPLWNHSEKDLMWASEHAHYSCENKGPRDAEFKRTWRPS